MTMFWRLVLVAVALARPTGLLAQPDAAQPDAAQPDAAAFRNHRYLDFYRAHRDPSYISPAGELGAPGTYVINGEQLASYFLLATPASRWSVAVTQRFMARTRTDRSGPIRTPSFRLGAQVYYRLSPDVVNFRYVEGQLFHHSNGQDGPVFRPNGTFNTETGDFSTNYLQATYNWGTHRQARAGTHYALGYRWHAPFFNHSEGLAGNYGFGRLLGQASYRILARVTSGGLAQTQKITTDVERLRLTLQVSYAVNPLTNWALGAALRRFNTELTAWYVPPFSRDAGVFATVGYYGEDPYNIYFNDRYAFLRLGIAAGFTRYTDHQN